MAGNLTAMIASIFSGSAVTADPYYEYTTLLLPGNGTNGAQNNTFLDASTNNFTITRNGNTTQGTFSPFSQTGWGNYFPGSAYLSVANNTALQLPTQDFTLEAWVYLNTLPSSGSSYTVFQKGRTGTSNYEYAFEIENNSGSMRLVCRTSSNGTSLTTANGNTIALTAGSWAHVAVTRTTTTASFWFNGATAGSGTVNATTYTGTAVVAIGANDAGASSMVGYISNTRMVKGVAVYTGAFTPPTSPLTATQSAGTNIAAITGTETSLLTCQSNRFVDNSSTPKTLTVTGSPSVQAFSPFNPTSSWSATTNGGSGYFDGTGDYLSVASNSAFALGTGDFEISFWLYPTSTTQRNVTFATVNAPIVYMNTSRQLEFQNYGVASIATTTNTLTLNAWNYCVASRVSGTLKLFINGVEGASVSNSTNWVQSLVNIGTDSGANNCNGYMSDVRIVKGSGVTSVTVPTAPLTNITNTSLLLNFTNAGIYDATSKNDLETVGNAQISTTQSKWGGSSMAFDGTGDYLYTITSNQNFTLGATFTIEFWIYNTKTSGFGGVLGSTSTNWYTGFPITYVSGGASTFTLNSYAGSLSKSGLSNNTWYYIAIVANNNSASLYVNGTLESGPITQAITGTASFLTIGRHDGTNGIGDWSGYLQDLRITKGVARTITAPTAAFPTL